MHSWSHYRQSSQFSRVLITWQIYPQLDWFAYIIKVLAFWCQVWTSVCLNLGSVDVYIWIKLTTRLNRTVMPRKIQMSLKTSSGIKFDGNLQETQTSQGLPAKLGVAGDHHVWSLGLCSWIHHLNLEGKDIYSHLLSTVQSKNRRKAFQSYALAASNT